MYISNDLRGSILNRFLVSLFSSAKTLSNIIHGLHVSLDYEKKKKIFQ
jgi:flagellin-specific chaperone FliS